jgi:hypothetical protein
MVTTNKLKEKSTVIMSQANMIGIGKLYITENYGGDQYSEDEYISPSSIIFEPTTENFRVAPDDLRSFKEFLISELSDTGISLMSKTNTEYNVLNNNILSESSKHLLDSAIDITQIDTEKSWKVQFEEQRNKVNLLSIDMSNAAQESLNNLEQELGPANKKRRTGVSFESDAEIKADDVLSVSSPTTLAAVDSVLGKQEFMRSIGLTPEDILFIKQRPGLFEKISNIALIADLTKPEERNMTSPARSPSPTKSRSSQNQEQQSSKT